MECVSQMVFIPRVPGHLHPVDQPCAYCHNFMLQHQQQQQHVNMMVMHREKIMHREKMPKRFIWMFPGGPLALKLNTDGSSRGNPGPSSFGGLIRDSHGRWLCGYMGKMKGRSFTSLEAELWSVFQGLRLIQMKNLSGLCIETDCLAVLLLGVDEGPDKDHPLRRLSDAINTIMIAQRCCLIHTRRDGNHSADRLAKLGAKQSEEFRVLEVPPPELIPYLLRDNQAATEWKNRKN